ncbi:MAG: HAMP domain-containing histidine kinase [Clostridia bacterium]|nr:HAMP domain-containing histidine kinase [Clostridia bacterium]
MLKSGITKRWILTTILVIALILLTLSAVVTFMIRGYYYDTVRNKLNAIGTSTAIADFFRGYLDVSRDVFAERAREYVFNYTDGNIAEVWIYYKDSSDVVVTSTGFDVASTLSEDYDLAFDSPSGRGVCVTELDSGEKVMALTVLLPRSHGKSNGAVRFITSMEEIDHKVVDVALIALVTVLFALILVVISGLFFIRSILVPVNRINAATKKIAAGKYNEKIPVSDRNDEIGELTESINFMTSEIARTDRMKSDFISTVSHELRTPLTAIKGWAETLLTVSDGKDETIDDGLRVILAESDRLRGLVEDLLDFSRMETGRMSLRIERIDILAELDDAVYVLRDRARREGIEIVYNTPDYAAPMDGDPDRIQQVFVNVIDNAIKYTPAGGRILILASLEANAMKISVSDTGCGISEEDLPHVKEKFYKANVSVKGSGIGLAVCDEIVQMHGGRLDISSKLGVGTTVDILLPMRA